MPALKTDNRVTTRTEALKFTSKKPLLQLHSYIRNISVLRTSRFPKGHTLLSQKVIAESRTPLWTETEPEERFLVAGKINNLRLAVRELDGLEIPAGQVFSFW